MFRTEHENFELFTMACCCVKGNGLAETKHFQEMVLACSISADGRTLRGTIGCARAPVTGDYLRMVLKSHWWWDLTTQDFSDLDAERMVAILPVGAVEQHGPHLPVRGDAAINAGIIERAVELMPADCPALVLPMMPVGKSDEHRACPGTLTLSYETLGRFWFELGESVHRAGIRKLLFFNSHGGQPQLLDIVCRDLRVKLGMFAVSVMWPRLIDMNEVFEADENRHGIHVGHSRR